MREVHFGIIGCGLMGREFASATARWLHLLDMRVRPRIVAICDTFASYDDDRVRWFKALHPEISQVTPDYRELLDNKNVDAVYVAVPHYLHREIYCATIASGKHLMGEKPFGIDLAANQAILATLDAHAEVFARCSSEMSGPSSVPGSSPLPIFSVAARSARSATKRSWSGRAT